MCCALRIAGMYGTRHVPGSFHAAMEGNITTVGVLT